MMPNKELWRRMNELLLGENAAEALVTLTSGMCALLVASGACPDEPHARAHLAATILSPDTGPVGSLMPLLPAELARLRGAEAYNPS